VVFTAVNTTLDTETAFVYIHDHFINAIGSQRLRLLHLPAAFDVDIMLVFSKVTSKRSTDAATKWH